MDADANADAGGRATALPVLRPGELIKWFRMSSVAVVISTLRDQKKFAKYGLLQ